MAIVYRREDELGAAEFIGILERSGLAERRPVGEPARIAAMLRHANLIVTARDGETLVGVSRALSDFSFCCYLSDLAVDRAWQGRGIGRQLIAETRAAAGPDSMCLLVAAPDARSYYPHIGMPRMEHAYMFPRER